jgi:hypothetical protein
MLPARASLLQRMSLEMAHSEHANGAEQCLLSGGKADMA